MGYYSDDTQERPYVNVKTILHRNDPILTCAPQQKPVDETGLLKGMPARHKSGTPLGRLRHPRRARRLESRGRAGDALHHRATPPRYPGHARQALHVACACQGGAYAGK